jgi:hypothetical protein
MFENILNNVDRLSKAVLGNETVDGAKSNALRMAIEKSLDGEGKVVSLKVDTTEKTCLADLMLEGETTSIRIDITRYSVECDASQQYIVIHEAMTSRKWINKLLSHVIPYRYKVPDQYKQVAALL